MNFRIQINRYTGRAIVQSGVLFFAFLFFRYSGLGDLSGPFNFVSTFVFGGLFFLLTGSAVYALVVEEEPES